MRNYYEPGWLTVLSLNEPDDFKAWEDYISKAFSCLATLWRKSVEPRAKDGEQWPLLGKDRLFTCTVRYDLGDHGLALLFDKDGLIAGAVLSYNEEIITPKAGEIKGFA